MSEHIFGQAPPRDVTPPEPTQFWDLSSPKMCRDFLKNLRMGDPTKGEGSTITEVQLDSGETVKFDDATDEQIVSFATQIAELITKPR